MSSTFGNLVFAQNTYTDNWTRGFPGQVADMQTMIGFGLETYANEPEIVMGRGVVRGVSQFQDTPSDVPFVAVAPFSITNPDPGTVAADLVGVAVRPFLTTTNIDEGGTLLAGYPEKSFAAVLPFGSARSIFVRIAIGVDILVGENVFIAINGTNDANIAIGEFSNDAAGTTGMIQVPNAQWWINKTSTTDDTVGVIKLF